ncbi:MAG: GspE/PulE family protein, partial [Nitrospirae bacterium]|nr:GspE/PulE family protein [Nitrospirota bacterium]
MGDIEMAFLKTQEREKIQEKERLQELEKKVLYTERLHYVTNKINSANNIDEILINLRDDILQLFDVDRLTIYCVDYTTNEIFSKYKVGTDIKEIRVPISPSSIAGYVASSMEMVNIPDVYDSMALKNINPDLKFDYSWDQKSGYKTTQVLAAPISFGNRLFGVIQLINKKDGNTFGDEDEKNILEIAKVLGIAFRNQTRMVQTRLNYLITQNIITEEEMKKAMSTARELKKDVETVLMEDYKIPKKEIGFALSQFYGCKFVEYTDGTRHQQKELLKGMNVAYLKRQLWVPISYDPDRDRVTVVIDNPGDMQKVAEVKQLFKARDYEFQVAFKSDILQFLEPKEVVYQVSESSISDILVALDEGRAEIDEEEAGSPELNENASTIVRLANQIIIDAYNKGASDIHVEPSKAKKTTDIRYRVDGACMRSLEIPFSHSAPLVSRLKIMANMDIAERRLPQDGKIKFKYKDKLIELRVVTLPTVGGEDVVMRVLAASEPMPLEALNLSERNLKLFKEILAIPYGIVLVVGPTGSGKTTTLHSALGHINTPERKIWTAEDPVEITQYGLRQVQVMPKIKFDFASAMRSFLRADPDVIMVGEMRDEETASIGIEASLTGHLVFSTLHTNSAPETITRLIDMGIDPFNFADALLGILAQRLVRTLCKQCKESYYPPKEEFEHLVDTYGRDLFPELGITYTDKLTFYRPKGCSNCNHTGYRGRTGIHELLIGSPTIKRLIQTKALMEDIREQAIKEGMRTLFQDGVAKVFKGFTDLKQVRS